MQIIDDSTESRTRTAPHARRWLLLGLPALLGAGVLATQSPAFGSWGRHGTSPAQLEKMIDKRVEQVLDRIDATDEQRARIKNSLAGAKPELKALAEERGRLRQAAHAALSSERVEPGEVERIRQETIKLTERGSAVLSRVLVEVAQVLQPAQRRELLEHWHHRAGPF